MSKWSAATAVFGLLSVSSTAFAQGSSAAPSGDASIGWCIINGGGITEPACVLGGGSVAVNPHVDGVIDAIYAYKSGGSGSGVSLQTLSALGGIRVGSPKKAVARVYGEFLGGFLFEHLTDTPNIYGFTLAPGVGADIKLTERTVFRPAFNVSIAHANGVWAHAGVFSFNIVWRQFKK